MGSGDRSPASDSDNWRQRRARARPGPAGSRARWAGRCSKGCTFWLVCGTRTQWTRAGQHSPGRRAVGPAQRGMDEKLWAREAIGGRPSGRLPACGSASCRPARGQPRARRCAGPDARERSSGPLRRAGRPARSRLAGFDSEPAASNRFQPISISGPAGPGQCRRAGAVPPGRVSAAGPGHW